MMIVLSAAATAAECQYIDKDGKSSKLDPAKLLNGASVESKSVNMLPSDVKQKLYDGSMTKCVTCTNNYVICK
jgi:hypothetical protein